MLSESEKNYIICEIIFVRISVTKNFKEKDFANYQYLYATKKLSEDIKTQNLKIFGFLWHLKIFFSLNFLESLYIHIKAVKFKRMFSGFLRLKAGLVYICCLGMHISNTDKLPNISYLI